MPSIKTFIRPNSANPTPDFQINRYPAGTKLANTMQFKYSIGCVILCDTKNACNELAYDCKNSAGTILTAIFPAIIESSLSNPTMIKNLPES
jgi:hypothetical protein